MPASDDICPGVSARVIADSISRAGARLTTMEVRLHRFVLPEFNTHRVFSRNVASSRATPVALSLNRAMHDPALPVSWGLEQAGMQGADGISAEEIKYAKELWLACRDTAVYHGRLLAKHHIHKSLVNRLLEPFLFVSLVVSSTEWGGFYEQRCSALAQPEMRLAAERMRQAQKSSEPVLLDYDSWHMPYIDQAALEEFAEEPARLREISVARCARVSYRTFDGNVDYEADMALYRRLITAQPPHASPLEHVATPCRGSSLGNFIGWRQLRHSVLPGGVRS
jgi:hypothetical protein